MALEALGIDLRAAVSCQVYYLDTADLALLARGVVLRARRRSPGEHAHAALRMRTGHDRLAVPARARPVDVLKVNTGAHPEGLGVTSRVVHAITRIPGGSAKSTPPDPVHGRASSEHPPTRSEVVIAVRSGLHGPARVPAG
jgi:hypothetical protein